jgi:NRPS condensation-like uncharacterized protein
MFNRKVTPAERFLSRSPFSIVTMVVRIKGEVSFEGLMNAVQQARGRHALLGARVLDKEEHEQCFTSEGAGDIPIRMVERKTKDDWIQIHADESTIPFDFDTRPPIRFILVHSPDESDLIILCHHVICDGKSLAYLARDLMMSLGDPGRPLEHLDAPPPMDLDNLPDDLKQSGLVKAVIQRMNKKWAEDSVYFDLEDYQELTRAYWDRYTHEILTIELSEEETSVLVARSREEQVTVNSALTAAFVSAQWAVQGKQPYHEKIAVGANLRDRLPNNPGEGMGYYAGAAELKFKYSLRKSFWENARDLHKKIQGKMTNKDLMGNMLNWLYLDPTILDAMHFKKLGGLVPPESNSFGKLSAFSGKDDVILGILKRDKLDSLETKYWGTAVTNLGRLDFPRTYGELELDRLIMQPGGGIPLANVNLVVGAVTCSGKLSLVIEYAEDAIDNQTVKRVRDQALKFLSEDESPAM